MVKKKGGMRLLSLLLCFCMVFGLVQNSLVAFAAGDGTDNTTPAEPITTSTVYDSADRKTATVTYHKEPIPSDPMNLIFLIDMAQTGGRVYEEYMQMMLDNGAGYIDDYAENSRSKVRAIGYQGDIIRDSGFLDFHVSFTGNFSAGSGTPGTGIANEPLVLGKVTDIIKEIENDYPTVVFWALGAGFQKDEAAVEDALKELKTALGDDGALITWQLAEEASPLLTEYASGFRDPHADAGTPETPAAFAEKDAPAYRANMADNLEQVVHDHYHKVTIPLRLNEGQTVVKRITGATYEAGSPKANLTLTVTEDGQGVDIYIDHLCRVIPVDISLTMELNENVHAKQEVIAPLEVSLPHDGANGGVHAGIFDEKLLRDLSMQVNAAIVDRSQYKLTFDMNGAQGQGPQAASYMPGQIVRIPMPEGAEKGGMNFGGWNVTGGTANRQHYKPGELIQMPEGDLELQAAWGQLEVELEIASTQGGATAGNQMISSSASWAQGDGHHDLFDFSMVTASDGKKVKGKIISVRFENQDLQYDTWKDGGNDPNRVQLTSVPNAVYARHVGATETDHVIAYLLPSQDNPGKYEMIVAGPGGVRASTDDNQSCEVLFQPLGEGLKKSILTTTLTPPASSVWVACLWIAGILKKWILAKGLIPLL